MKVYKDENEVYIDINRGTHIDWESASVIPVLSVLFMKRHCCFINWTTICQTRIMPESTIRKFQAHVDWGVISGYELSAEFIEEFAHKIEQNP